MSDRASRRRARREARRNNWQSRREESDSAFVEAWYRYREAFSVLPSPAILTAEENEGAVSMGAVRIPALLVYAPVYYILLILLAFIVYPPLLLYTLIVG